MLHRTGRGIPPFQGLWSRLTPWSILEFKGPTVSARVEHVDSLVEIGLGIDRRLNEEQGAHSRPRLGRSEVSFWYIANSRSETTDQRLLNGLGSRAGGEVTDSMGR